MTQLDDIILAKLVRSMKWRWSLEKISEGSLGDRWIVWDENHVAIADSTTPDDAIDNAFNCPYQLTDAQRKYSSQY